ncbi:hypothetical protein GS610_21425 [Ruegeria sp. HKCCD6228]|nr:hypothetical protein [Ruegeria sp. HKCCD6228]
MVERLVGIDESIPVWTCPPSGNKAQSDGFNFIRLSVLRNSASNSNELTVEITAQLGLGEAACRAQKLQNHAKHLKISILKPKAISGF